MMTRYSAWLDGVALHEIDPAIYIMDIEESTPQINTLTANRGTGDGMILLSRRRTGLQVNIRVMIHEYDTIKRKNIMQRIAAWALKGKYLTISDRPGQRLRVICTAPPVINSALKWTNTLNITFTAYAVPYWENEITTKATITGSSGTAEMRVPGTAEKTPVEATVQNTGSGTLTQLTLTVGATKMAFAGLNVAAGASMHIYYDDDGVLRLPIGQRTAESSDELLAVCGENNALAVTANTAVSVTFEARGRYV